MKFRRIRQMGRLSIVLLTFVFAFALIYVNQSNFETELQANFDRTRGAYDNQLVTRSHSYLLEAMHLFNGLGESPTAQADVLKELDLAYAFLNIGRYRELYPCTAAGLDAILDLRFRVEQGLFDDAGNMATWHTALSCQSFIDEQLNERKVFLAGRMLQESQQSRFWTNLILVVSYFSTLLVSWMYERQRYRTAKSHKDKMVWQQKAQFDHLTGCGNRLALEERLRRLLSQWPSMKKDVSIFFYDLDHFKAYNDDFGHVAGDEALKSVSKVVQDTVQGYGQQYRYGGEEFVVLLDDVPLDKAKDLVCECRQAVEALNIPHSTSCGDVLTISAGMYSLERRRYDLEELLDHADQLLYQAKVKGRNRTIIYSSDGMGVEDELSPL